MSSKIRLSAMLGRSWKVLSVGEPVVEPCDDCGEPVVEGEHHGKDSEWLCCECYGNSL